MRSIRMFGDHVAPPSSEREKPTRTPTPSDVSASFHPTKSRPWASTTTNGSTWCENGVVPSVTRTFGVKPGSGEGAAVAIGLALVTERVAITRHAQITEPFHPRMGLPRLGRIAEGATSVFRCPTRRRPVAPTRTRLHEERHEDEGDRRQELHEDVEARARGVLERIPHRVPHDGGLVGRAPLPAEAPRLDELLRVVPRPAPRVEHEGHEDARDRPDHEGPAQGLRGPPARRPDPPPGKPSHPHPPPHGEDPGDDHLPEGAAGADVD